MNDLDEIIRGWSAQSLPLLPPHNPTDIISALASTGKPFAQDIVDLYRTTGGIDGTMDNHYFSLWPLHRVRFENLHSPDPDLAFADVLVDSFHFTLHYEFENRSSVYGGYDRRRVADSLDEFWQMFLSDPRKLDLT